MTFFSNSKHVLLISFVSWKTWTTKIVYNLSSLCNWLKVSASDLLALIVIINWWRWNLHSSSFLIPRNTHWMFSVKRCSWKFPKIHWKTPVPVSFLIKLQVEATEHVLQNASRRISHLHLFLKIYTCVCVRGLQYVLVQKICVM